MPSSISPQTVKLKSTLRLLITRLRTAQKKDTSISISARREMSILLTQSRIDSARIRVENIIQTDICVELMEILELYAELLLARAGLLDARDKERKEAGVGSKADGLPGGMDTGGLEEAAAAIIYAAPRLPRDVRELGIVRGLLVERFGKEFSARVGGEGGGGVVPKRVLDKLRVEPPGEKLVDAYLGEIARTYGVDWPRATTEGEELGRVEREIGVLEDEVARESQRQDDNKDDGDEDGGGGTKSPIPIPTSTSISTSTPQKPAPLLPTASSLPLSLPLSRATPPPPPSALTPRGARSPISVAPPAARSDNLSPKVRLPDGQEASKGPVAAAAARSGGGNGGGSGTGGVGGGGGGGKVIVGGKIPDVDELAKRFALLKR